MTDTNDRQHRSVLQRIAHRVMLERRLAPAFPPQALADLDDVYGPATRVDKPTRDLRNLLWCSIDNDDSRDLDQLTVAEAMPHGAFPEGEPTMPSLTRYTPDRSKLFGSHGQRPWFKWLNIIPSRSPFGAILQALYDNAGKSRRSACPGSL